MDNFKAHYLLYTLVSGLLVGWAISTIIGAVLVTPKQLPVAKVVKANNAQPIAMITNKIIDANIFALDLSTDNPNYAAETASSNSGGNGDAGNEDDNTVAPPPPFKAQLVGVFQLGHDDTGLAIIIIDSGTIVLSTGNTKENITLLSLDMYSALIERDKKKYTLVLEGASTMQNTAGRNNKTPEIKDAPTAAAITTGSNINISLSKSDIKDELKDLNKILQSALVSPFYAEGEYIGYRVTRMKEDSALAKLGLKQGDIIARIDGSALTSPEPLFSMLTKIDDISAINIDMIRDNEKKTIFVELN